MPKPIIFESDTLSRPGKKQSLVASQRRGASKDTCAFAQRLVIMGYTTEPSKTHRAKDGTDLFDPIHYELADNAFHGLRDIAAGICGAKVHQVVELPERTPLAQLGRLAERVKTAREQHSDLPPCCRVVKELGQRETLQQQLADQVRMVL